MMSITTFKGKLCPIASRFNILETISPIKGMENG